MKTNIFKTAFTAMAAVVIFAAMPQNAFSQVTKKNAKQEEKQASKNFKEKVKELEKEGWKIAGDYRTLELALIEHQNKVDANPEKYGTAVGEVDKCRSIDACKQMVQFQVQRNLAEQLSADFQGISTQLSNMSYVQDAVINNLVTAFTRYTQADVSGLITPSYSLVKENGDGTKQFRTIYILDLQKKTAVQESALEKSLKETKLTVEQASEVQKFVKQAFEEKVVVE